MRAPSADHASGNERSQRQLNWRRLFVFAGIAASEILLGSFLFDPKLPPDLPLWQNPVLYANGLAKVAIVALLLFGIVAWSRRQEIIAAHTGAAEDDWGIYLIANIGLFSASLVARFQLSHATEPSLTALLPYTCLFVATGASLALLAAPLSFWLRLLKLAPVEIAVAGACASVSVGAGWLAQGTWNSLSSATLMVSHWFLTFYEPNVFLDTERRILGAGDFRVQVFDPCSGYEGVALIVSFLSVYLWIFRRDLRFPNALVLLPICVAVIWVLNALRIAVLVSIGAHVDPAVAVEGFHSVAGWVSFLIVTLSSIAVSRKLSFFAVQAVPREQQRTDGPDQRLGSGAQSALEFLAPFMALTAASILASAFAPHDQWLYAVKVAGVGATLWWFRGAYLPLISGASLSSVVIGLAVGLVWIATDPSKGLASPLGPWLQSLPAWLAAVWLSLRAFGSIALVPAAEELAFRGYLARALISIRFESIGFGEFRWLAFIGSSVAFGLMHQRWVAACLAGAVYALLMYRSKRLSDPIAAHVASNAAIMGWAIAAQQWSLL
jgi:exosortase E/protease (VPEID-CTERM system)